MPQGTPKKDRTAGVVVGCLAGSALLFAALIGGAAYVIRQRVQTDVLPTDSPEGPKPGPESPFMPGQVPQPGAPGAQPQKSFSDAPTVGFTGDLEWQRPIEAADMTRVDIVDVLAQARPMAEKLQPGAQLVSVVAFEIQGGLANMMGESRVSIDFEFQGIDKTQPPGKDSVEYRIDVQAQKGVMTGRRMKWPTMHLKHLGGALDMPTCKSANAWSTATSSGVPSNSVATIHYYSNKSFSPKNPFVWSVRVDGHDEYRREIDGKSCKMVKNWGGRR